MAKKKARKIARRPSYARLARRRYTFDDIGKIAECASGGMCHLSQIGFGRKVSRGMLDLAKSIFSKFRGQRLRQQPAFLWAKRAYLWAKRVQPDAAVAKEAASWIRENFPGYSI